MEVAQRAGQPHGGRSVHALTAEFIATAVGGTLLGDPKVTVTSIAPLERAEPCALSFLGVAKYAPLLNDVECGVLLVSPELADSPGNASARVVVAKPHEAMLLVLNELFPRPLRTPSIHPTAVLGRGARLGPDAQVDAYVVIGARVRIGERVTLHAGVVIADDVSLGDDCELFPGVTLYTGTQLGDRVRIHSGARIGSDGFGYTYRDGAHEKIQHVGRCIVDSDVEIGANTTIDRGSIDDTVIGAGTRIDNLVHIAHNVHIGKLCLIMAQVGIAGSVRVEDGCILAGQVGISGHHTIGARATLAAQAGVFGDIPAGEIWSGYPARPHRESLRAQAALFRLPSIMRALERLVSSVSPASRD